MKIRSKKPKTMTELMRQSGIGHIQMSGGGRHRNVKGKGSYRRTPKHRKPYGWE